MNKRPYTPQEAAAVSGASLAYIQKAITTHRIPTRPDGPSKRRKLDRLALMAFALAEALPRDVSISIEAAYRLLVEGIASEEGEVVLDNVVRIDTAKALKDTRERLALLQRAEELIVRDPAIMGGAPTIRGTRITAHAIAGRFDDGDTVEIILEDYPYLDRETVEAAALFAKANPARGRPSGKLRHRDS
jgi:uncharacterized protein (DUF433 family)